MIAVGRLVRGLSGWRVGGVEVGVWRCGMKVRGFGGGSELCGQDALVGV